MKARNLAAVLLAGVLGAAASFPSMADTRVDAVYLSLASDIGPFSMSPGEYRTDLYPEAADGDYYISDIDIQENSSSGILTCTMDIYAADGAYFDSNTMVSVYAAYSVNVSRSSDRIRVTAKAYPLRVLDEVSDISIDWNGKEATWTPVEGASSYSVVILYSGDGGNIRQAKKTVKGTKISLSGYVDQYDYVAVAVRPSKGSAVKDRYVAEPNYTTSDGGAYDEEYVNSYEFDLPTSVSGTLADGTTGSNPFDPAAWSSGSSGMGSGPSGSASGPGGPAGAGSSGSTSGSVSGSGGPAGTGSSSGASGSGSASGSASGGNGWVGGGDTWYYETNGVRTTGWLSVTADEWYYFDGSGLMKAGWINDGAYVYLLNLSHDGTYGKMLTGFQAYNGFTYYFNEIHDGYYGAMYTNKATPDGRWADENGIVR